MSESQPNDLQHRLDVITAQQVGADGFVVEPLAVGSDYPSCKVVGRISGTEVAALGIDKAMEQGIAYAPSYRVSLENLNRLQFLYEAVENNWHPSLDAQFNQSLKPALGLRSASATENKTQYGISLQQDLNFWKLQTQRELALSGVDSGRLESENSRQITALNVAVLYLEVLRLRELRRVSAEYLELLNRFQNIVGQQYDAGAVSSVQNQRLEVAIKRSETDYLTLNQQFLESIVVLEKTLGSLSIEAGDLEVPGVDLQEFSDYGEDDLVSVILDENVTLKRLKEDLQTAILETESEEWNLYPEVTLDLSSTRNHRRRGGTKTEHTAQVNVALNLWDGRRTRKNIAASQAGQKVAIARVDQQRLALDIEARRVFSGYKTALSESKYSREACVEAQGLLELQQIDFSTKTSSEIFNLVTSAGEWFATANQNVAAYFDALNAIYQIKALRSDL
ncbi:TolC family protein [Kiloniella sp. b19]|uniref:TolC family protein n=1 Tax=Kiloniella sp. GXU_MW_B19 TaxID=3141326 RepID=UPI0031D45681